MMSNPYPPTPSYGGAYNGYPYSDPRLREGGLQTLPGGGLPPPPPNGGSYHVPLSANPSPAVNHQNFHANANTNATISTTLHPHPSHIPPPPPPFHVSPEFFKQFSNSNLPPPPYPPVPIPHLGFNQFPPAPSNFATTSTPPSNTVTNTSVPHQQNPSFPPTNHTQLEYQQDSYTVNREEGELSDGELDESSPEPMIEPSRSLGTNPSILSVMRAGVTSSNTRAPPGGMYESCHNFTSNR
jgi:hypothetical protein